MQHSASEGTACRQGQAQCVGCCLDLDAPRWRLVRFLRGNTAAYCRRFPGRAAPRRASFLAHELERRRGADLLSALLLLFPPLAWVRAVYEKHHIGCAWVGYLDPGQREVGCLLHPARNAGIDLRRVAPYISDPLRWCAPDFQCTASLKGHTAQANDWWAYSRAISSYNQERAHSLPKKRLGRVLATLVRRKLEALLLPLSSAETAARSGRAIPARYANPPAVLVRTP